MIAATSWPEALIVIFAILFGTIIASAPFWRGFGIGRAAIEARAKEYRRLAEEATAAQKRTADALEQLTAELKELSSGTRELERMLKEVG